MRKHSEQIESTDANEFCIYSFQIHWPRYLICQEQRNAELYYMYTQAE